MPHDATHDFAPITQPVFAPNLMMVHPAVPAKTVKEMIVEGGLPGDEAVQWYGLLAPAGTPHEIIARLHRESAAILRLPESRERIAGDGAEVVASSPDEFAAFIRAETVKWAKVARAAGIQPE